jgi:hypothetical protein
MGINRYTFTELVTNVGPNAGGDHIVKCGQLLHNKMQCDKVGVYWVKDNENPDKPSYQVCKAHGVILESEGKDWVAPKALEEPKVEPAAAGSLSPEPAKVAPTVADLLNKK